LFFSLSLPDALPIFLLDRFSLGFRAHGDVFRLAPENLAKLGHGIAGPPRFQTATHSKSLCGFGSLDSRCRPETPFPESPSRGTGDRKSTRLNSSHVK